MYSLLDLEKYAEVLHWCLARARGKALRKSDLVEVSYDPAALPLAEAVVVRLHEAGAAPVPRVRPTSRMERRLYAESNVKRLIMEIPGDREFASKLAGTIQILAPDAVDHLEDIDPDLFGKAERSRQGLRDLLAAREAAGEYARTVAVYPTEGQARAAGLAPEEYGRKLREMCMLGRGTPLTDWKLLVQRMDNVLRWLNSLAIQTVRIQSENMDLLFRVGAHRRWQGFTGRNLPSFEFYVAPDWRTVEGVFSADLPSCRRGNVVERAVVEFLRGEAVKFSASRGLSFALEQLRMDSGACRLGEFSLVDRRFSTVDRYMANPILDENFGGEPGACHIGLGQAPMAAFNGPLSSLDARNAAELGFNRSALHWDLVNTGPTKVTAHLAGGGSMVIYENGEFCNDARC